VVVIEEPPAEDASPRASSEEQKPGADRDKGGRSNG
jgi:hypothetical protein